MRHDVLREFVCKLDDVDVDRVLLPAFFKRRTDARFTNLKELSSIVMQLQFYYCTIHPARAYFDAVLNVFPTVDERLNWSALIMHSLVFVSAVIKI